MGPWSPGKTGLDEAWTEFDAWAKNKRTGGGAFGLRKGSSRSATAKKGAQQLYECSRAGKYTPAFSHVGESKQRQCGSEKCECPWGVWLEESDEGWVSSQMKGGGGDRRGSHNHELAKSHYHIKEREQKGACGSRSTTKPATQPNQHPKVGVPKGPQLLVAMLSLVALFN